MRGWDALPRVSCAALRLRCCPRYQSSLGTFDHPQRFHGPPPSSAVVAEHVRAMASNGRRSVNPEEVVPVQDCSTTAVPQVVYHVHPWSSTRAESGLPGGHKVRR